MKQGKNGVNFFLPNERIENEEQEQKEIYNFINVTLRNLHFLDDFSKFSVRYPPRDILFGTFGEADLSGLFDEEEKEWDKVSEESVISTWTASICYLIWKEISSGNFRLDENHDEIPSDFISQFAKEPEEFDLKEEYLTLLFKILAAPVIPTNVSKEFEKDLTRYFLTPQNEDILDISDKLPENMEIRSLVTSPPAAALVQRPCAVDK